MESLETLILAVITLGSKQLSSLFFTSPPSPPSPQSQRILFFDFAKGVAMLAVIIIHCVYFFIPAFHATDTLPYLYVVNNLFRFAVPVFFIVAGALTEQSFTSAGAVLSFYYKKCIHLIIPYILLSGMLAFAHYTPLREFLISLLTGEAAVPYYFLVVLFQFYLLAPFFIRIAHFKKILWVAFFISVISILTPQTWYVAGIPSFFPFTFFFLFGMVRAHTRESLFPSKHSLLLWVAVGVLSIVLSVFLLDFYYNFRLLYGTASFVILWYVFDIFPSPSPQPIRILSFIGRHSFWIYLTHFGTLFLLFTLSPITAATPPTTLWFLSGAACVLSISIGVCSEYVYRITIGKLFSLPRTTS